MRQSCERLLGKNNVVFRAFMDLEKAYDNNRYESEVASFGRGTQSFYVGSSHCVRVGNNRNEIF